MQAEVENANQAISDAVHLQEDETNTGRLFPLKGENLLQNMASCGFYRKFRC